MANFIEAIAVLLKDEGGYAPSDNGRGPVNHGITQKTYDGLAYPARRGWPLDVKDLTELQAQQFYHEEFWGPIGADRIQDQRVATLIFSLAVNCGSKRAAKWLQMATKSKEDGIVGVQTVLNTNAQTPAVTIANLKKLAWDHYQRLANENPAEFADDLAGWKSRLEKLT